MVALAGFSRLPCVGEREGTEAVPGCSRSSTHRADEKSMLIVARCSK